MRKKNAGALFMDFEVSPEDRIGGASPRGRGKGKPAAKAKSRKPAKSERVEPGFGGFFTREQHDDEPAPRRRGGAPKSRKPQRGQRQRKPFSLWRLFGKLFYWLTTLGVVAAICVAGVVYYYWMQMPASTSWKVPDRPANIRIVAADGQMMSNRGKMGGEAVSLAELPQYVPAAFIAIEDKRFYSHFGIDVMGLGADLAIDYRSENVLDKVLAWAPGGVDVIMDTVGQGTLADGIAMTKPGGVIAPIGTLIPDEPQFDPVAAEKRNVRIVPTMSNRVKAGDYMRHIVDLYGKGVFKAPEITVMKLEQAAEAHRMVKDGHVRGKIVLHVADL